MKTPKKLLDQVRDAIRVKHYSYRTEEMYVQWIRRHDATPSISPFAHLSDPVAKSAVQRVV